jgi:hypothetical protein
LAPTKYIPEREEEADMKMYVLFADEGYDVGESTSIYSITSDKRIADNWEAEAYRRNKNVPEDMDIFLQGKVKEIDFAEELFLQRTVSRPHDGNGFCNNIDIVTFSEFSTKKADLIKEEVMPGGYFPKMLSDTRGGITLRDYNGGLFFIVLTHRVSVNNGNLEFIKISNKTLLLKRKQEAADILEQRWWED